MTQEEFQDMVIVLNMANFLTNLRILQIAEIRENREEWKDGNSEPAVK